VILQLTGNERKIVPLDRTGIEIAMKTTTIRTKEQEYLTLKH